VVTLLVSIWTGVRIRFLWLQANAESALFKEFASIKHEQLIAETTHGPHETAWWFAGATIKLGLLGTVVGFVVMAQQIGNIQAFDFEQVRGLLKDMTNGMAIALYTTFVGLVANLWLGLLLTCLDRLGDRIAAAVLAQRT
jgi:hypothetical protein